MSTIAREFTKEQLQQIIETDHVQCGEASALARIALASLEAEAVGEVVLGEYDDCGCHPDARVVCIAADGQADWENFKDGTRLYAAPPSLAAIDERAAFNTWNNDENLPIAGVGAKNAAWLAWQARSKLTAPPAPAHVNAEPVAWLWSHRKHPSEVTLVRPEDDERAEGAHWSGWSCQALYAAPPAPVSVPDEVCWEDVPEEITEDDMALASAWAHGFNQCRAAMLKHSEPFIVTSDHRMMEMPQVEAINAVTAMLQGVENAETPTTMQTAPALDSSPKIAELPSGNSPVIPDGWVLVPEEPTHEMLEAGDEQFGTYDVYRRMIAASPQQEVKS